MTRKIVFRFYSVSPMRFGDTYLPTYKGPIPKKLFDVLPNDLGTNAKNVCAICIRLINLRQNVFRIRGRDIY